jgi:hypothetical protein
MARRDDRRFYAVLAAVTAAALAWRVAYVLWQKGRIPLYGDAAYYHWQSIDLSRGLGFLDPAMYEFYGRVTPSAGHPPAYLVYLAGVSRFVGTSETTHRLASCLLGAGAVFVIGVLARKVFRSDLAGWLAAGFAAAYAHLWINDEMLMSESMYVLTTALAVLGAYTFWERRTVRAAAVMGAGIALAALSRAEALALFPLLVVPLAFFLRDRRLLDRAKLALVAGTVGALVLSPWVLYNLTRFEHPVLMSNGVGSVLMVANCDYTLPEGDPNAGEYVGTYRGDYVGYWSVYCAADMVERIRAYFPPERAEELLDELGPVAFPNGHATHWFGDESTHEVAWRALGLEEMDRHRDDLPRVVVLRVLRMWDVFRPRQNIDPFNAYLEGRGLWQTQVAYAQYYPLLALSVAGLVVLRRRRVPIAPFVALAATVTVTAATAFGITRYRAPVDAMLPVLAGGAVAVGIEVLAARERRRRAAAAPAGWAPPPLTP